MNKEHSDGFMPNAYPKRRMFSAIVLDENPEENAQDMKTVKAVKKVVAVSPLRKR